MIAGMALFLFGTSQAQEVTFGVKTGLNLKTLYGDGMLVDIGYTPGFMIGGFAQIPISSKLFLQPELMYSTQGASDDAEAEVFPDVFQKVEESINLSYINIPILLDYHFTENICIKSGPQLGLLMKSQIEKDDFGIDITEYSNRIDFAWVLGSGYELESGIFFDLRYNLGLRHIFEEAGEGEDGIQSEGDVKNEVIQMAVGYHF